MGSNYLSVTDTIRIRPVDVVTDVDIALPWYRDMEVLKGTAAVDRDRPYDQKTVEGMFRYLARIGESFLIEVKERDDWIPVGDAALSKKDVPIVIGRRDYWGRGIAREVLGFLLRRAREAGFGRIGPIEIYRSNLRSLNLYRSAGFREISSDETSVFLEKDL